MTQSALADLRVVELGNFISAAYAAKLMADLGAEVVKIEPPGIGDESRRHGPFPDDIPDAEKSGLHIYLNTNKLGVTLDVSKHRGRDLFLRLVKDADVVVENNHPSRLSGLGLDFEALAAVNPALIVTSITPFGQQGPYRDWKAHAINVMAASGQMFRMGDPERPPLNGPLSRANYMGAYNAASATMVAVLARAMTGRGQHVDISEAQCIATFVAHQDVLLNYKAGVPVQGRSGQRMRRATYPAEVMPCKDGHMFFQLVREDFQNKFFEEALGAPDWWKDNPRYHDWAAMGRDYPEEVDGKVAPWFMARTKKEIWDLCRKIRVPVHPMQTIQDQLDSDHLAERQYLVEVEVPGGMKVRVPGAPWKLARTPWAMRRPSAPRLGEHNRLVYGERLGLTESELAELAAEGVV